MADPSDILSLAKRRGFLWPSYDIYGGVAGLYDYGPLGAEMKRNIEDYWRQLYIRQEGFFELVCPTLAPREVFEASGHLEEFTDLVAQCISCSTSFRADHLAEGLHDHPSTLCEKDLCQLLNDNNVVCPECGGKLAEPTTFNLMFKTTIGAGAAGRDGYFRPETAQGMFVNFGIIYRYGREKLPIGVVQIGRSMRNEISPRQGVIRLREFNMMEAELFVNPEQKNWPRLSEVKDEEIVLLSHESEEAVTISLGRAMKDGLILNETLAYFMWLTWKYLVHLGIDEKRMRYRQHARTEIAHYAIDCWDCEALLSYGWIELVGVADRGCYDLSAHLEHSGADLTAFERFDAPREVDIEKIVPNHARIGPLFKSKAKQVAEKLSSLPTDGLPPGGAIELEVEGTTIDVPGDCYKVVKSKEKVTGRKIIPHVIEPSYGTDRIIYALIDHAYHVKDEYVRLGLSGLAAPIKLGIFPLVNKDNLDNMAKEIYDRLTGMGISCYYDDSGSIGRRYARMDEIGTPFCITVDYDTKNDNSVTVRDRDSTDQVRIKIDRLPELALNISQNLTMEELRKQF